MKFQITSAGLAAAFAASNLGPKIELPKFRIGSAYGYEPTVLETGIRGNLLYEGATSGYTRIDDNTCEYTCIMSETVGTWEFGEIALIMPDGTTFAQAALQKPQYKVAYPDQDFNRFRVQIRLDLSQDVPIITMNAYNLSMGIILELDSVENLINPNDADVNAYICHTSDDVGNHPVCTKSGTRWNISTHHHRVLSGVVSTLAIGGRSVTSPAIAFSRNNFPIGRYLIQFISGIQQGTVRVLGRMDLESASWNTPVLGVYPGDRFEILQSNASYDGGADEVAMFYSLMMKRR